MTSWRRSMPKLSMSENEYRRGVCRKQIIMHDEGDIARPVNKMTSEVFGIGTCIKIITIEKGIHGFIVHFKRTEVKTLI